MRRIRADSPDMSSSWLMVSLSMRGGSLLEKKSLRAVATAFTGMSNECMSTLPSENLHFFLQLFSTTSKITILIKTIFSSFQLSIRLRKHLFLRKNAAKKYIVGLWRNHTVNRIYLNEPNFFLVQLYLSIFYYNLYSKVISSIFIIYK